MKNINRFPNRIKLDIEKESKNPMDYTKEEIDRITDIVGQDQELSSIRGQIITSVTNIETHLTEAICSLIFKKDKITETIMKDFVFGEEFFTFNQKWKLFRNILNSINVEFTETIDFTRLKTDIKKIIEIRNNFAHGEFTYTKNKAYLEFRKNSKIERIEVDENYFEYLSSFFNSVVSTLQKVIFLQKPKPSHQ